MNPIDKLYEVFTPSRAVKRQRSRIQLAAMREYEAARPRRSTKSYSRRGGRASDEVSRGHRALAGGAQDLVRNTALGHRIKAVIATNMIGTGIVPDYVGGPKREAKRHKSTFEAWAESTACDAEGHHNFYGLQHLWAATVVESGGVFVRQIINNALAFPLVLQTLEQQYLDTTRSRISGAPEGSEIVDGIQYNGDGIIEGYWLKTQLVGNDFRAQSTFFSTDEIIHIYRKDRPGQHLGVSWLHPVADLVDQRQEWRDGVLMQQRIASSYGIVIKGASSEMTLEKAGGQALHDSEGYEYSEIEPGMIAYMDGAGEITTVSPPNISHATDFNSQVVQDIAVGVGITREQLTNDFSQVTWASGRLARGEFYANLDRWQQFVMIPALNKVHDWFDQIYTVKYGSIKGLRRSWIVPHRSAVNPKEELEVDIRKVRTAAMTPQQFTRKHGQKFEDAIASWKEAKAMMGEMPFDLNPANFSPAGNQMMGGKEVENDEKKDSKQTDDTD